VRESESEREGQRAGDEGEWAEGEERRRSGAQNGC